MFNVGEIMTREPYTLGTEDTLLDARELMANHCIRHVPIVNPDGNLLGLVSQRDVLGAADSNLFRAQSGAESKELYVALGSVMTAPVQTVDEKASLRGAAMHMQNNKLGCLPVVRKNTLVGIVTDADFVSVAINLMEQLETVEPEEDLSANDDMDDMDDMA